MSSRKTKRSQKLGSSRRNKNRNRETEEIDNDDGFQDPGNEEHESEQSQFLTVSEKQSSNESSLLHPDQPVIACTNPSTSVLEFSPQPQSQDFKDLLGQADMTSKKRKMGSTRKGNRNFKYEGIYDDEAEYKVQLSEGVSNELEVPVEASIKEDGGKEDQTSLVDCAPSQSSENESSVLQGKHLNFDTILQNEDDSKNDEHQHFEETLQSKPMDISSSELNQSKEAELSQNLIDDQSSSTFVIKDILEGSHAEDIGQDELTGVQSASLINEHEHVTEVDKVATVIWENVNSKASTEDENTVALCLEHTDETLQLTQETIYKSESTEVREDTGKYKEVSAAWDRTDNDSDEGLASTNLNLNQTMEPDTNIVSPLKLKDQEIETSSEQFLSHECKVQGDSEIKCYTEEQNDLSEAKCWTGESSADEDIAKKEVNMHYDEEKYRAMGTEREVENDDMQSVNCNQLLFTKVSSTNMLDVVTESSLIHAETLYEETEISSQTCNLQHNNPVEFPIELDMHSKEGYCSDQMIEKVVKFSDIETEAVEEENNDIKEEINAGSIQSFTKEVFVRVDDEKAGMSTFMNELEMSSVITNTQDYTVTDQASMVVEEHGIESPDKGGTSPYPTSDLMETISETQVKLDMPVYNPIAVPDQKQNMYVECQAYPTNTESEAEQFERTFPVVYIQESRLVQDDSVAEIVGFSPSKKNEVDSSQRILTGNNSGGETLSFTVETCYPQSSESLSIIEPEAEKMDENVIKAVVVNENTNTSQEHNETPQYISTEVVNTNQECCVLDRQDEETVIVEDICGRVDSTHAELSDVAEYLVDTEVLKMQSRAEVAVRNEEETWEGDKHGQPISLEDPRQNTYPDLKLEQSKPLECTEIHSKTLQATSTPIQEEAHMLISRRRKMGSIRRTLGGKKEEKDQEKDTYEEEKDMDFTKRATLLGPENGVIEKKKNDKKEEINAGPKENFTAEAEHTQEYMYSEISSQTFSSSQTTIKHPSTENSDFQEDQEKSRENVEDRSVEIDMQTPKKKKIGSTHNLHGRPQPPAEREDAEWTDLGNSEEIKHQNITQAATLILLTEQNTISAVTPNIHDSAVTTEQTQIITTEVETGTGGIDAPPVVLSVEVDQISAVVSDEVSNAEGLTDIIEHKEKSGVHEEKDSEVIHLDEQYIHTIASDQDQNSTNTGVIEEDNNDTKEDISAGPKENFTQEDITTVCSQQNVLCELFTQTTDLGLTTVEYPSPATEHHDFRKDDGNSIENLENRNAEIQKQTQTKKKKKFGSTRRPHEKHQLHAEREEGEWKDLENAEETEHHIITQPDTSNLLPESQNTMSEVTPNIHDAAVTTEQTQIITTEVETGTGGIDAPPVVLSVEVDQISAVVSDEVSNAEGLTDIIEHKEKSGVHEEKDSEVIHLDEQYIHTIASDQDQNSTNTGVIEEDNNDTKEDISAGPKENFTQEDITTVCSQQNVLCELFTQTTDLGLTTVEYPSPATEHHDFRKDDGNSIENLENRNAEIQKQTQTKKKKKFGSTRRPHEKHQLHAEREEGEWKDLENAEETEHHIITQPDTSNLLPESQNTMSEVTPNIHDAAVTTEQTQIITTEVETGTGGIDAPPVVLSVEVDQISAVVSDEVSDLYFISEPESPPISHPVSEARPEPVKVREASVKDTNTSNDAGLVSLDSIMKTSPSVVSTGGKQKIDFEQWNEQIPDFGQTLYNIVMVGNSNVGKTSFIKRLQSGQFIQDYSATIGVDTFVHTVTFGSRTVKLYVWDTAGQERYHSITRQVFHKAQGLLLMYDITSSQSFHAVRAWISQIKENAPTDVIVMLLGNKNDCADREVQLQQGEDLSKEYDIHFMECSVATGENVSESLKTLAWLLLKQRVRKEEEYTTLQPKPQSKKSGCC
ncbi:hypothetical protein QTP70_026536 [Hemibagrus guttatus]|uniref:Ras-related protein Rab-44 n=1 Tax=Hemibagrus guttatus TaxID=175788 RepID=A0AAE0RJN0_9TELE|nr:hypothetical protein QTP70_026536 [Hemibagrus guttatus]